MAYPAAVLHKLRAKDVADLLGGVDRNLPAQLAALAVNRRIFRVVATLSVAVIGVLSFVVLIQTGAGL